MHTDENETRQAGVPSMPVNAAHAAKRVLKRFRYLCGDYALNVVSQLRRWSWRARRLSALTVRRVELRASRATGRRREFDRGLRKEPFR